MKIFDHNRNGRDPAVRGPALALVGCGAIAESFYLPALAKAGLLGQLVLVDRDGHRVDTLGSAYGIARRASDYTDVLGKVDGVIVAVPHHLHHDISVDFLRSGVHTLCEKPLAETAAQLRSMISVACEGGVQLAVNNTRRLFPSYRKVEELIASKQFGEVKSIAYYEGGEFSWPTSSGFYFSSEFGGKGVLLDRGAHVVDLVCWWMGRKPELVSFYDDSFGGCEAVCEARLKTAGCNAIIKLSWLNKLRNRFVVVCEGAEFSGEIYDWRRLTVSRTGASRREKVVLKTSVRSFGDYADQLVANFVDVIRGTARPLISADDVADSIDVIEQCYRHRRRFAMPWAATPDAAGVAADVR